MPRLDSTFRHLRRWDDSLCLSLNRAQSHAALLWMFRGVNWLGDGVFWYALMLALLLAHGAGAALPVLHMILVGIACTSAYKLLKRGTLRPRPYEVLERVAAGAVPLDGFSFPSGHTLHAVAFTLVACSYFPTLAALLVSFTLLTAASRVILGLHYPSDVLAGAGIGALIGCVSLGI
jgi:undecaprenyl-diphosphatase